VRALSPAQILERLDERLPLLIGGPRDAPERQRTLRATIGWSHELLSPDERRLFARLSVFSGGCTLEAAEQVADAEVDTLQSLVEKSLVRRIGGRYSMLETIREYAAECLEDAGEAAAYGLRHAEYFVSFAEEIEPHLRWSGRPAEWLERLQAEHDNLRVALDRLAAAGEGQLSLRLAAALARFWVMQGHLAEGRHRLEAALALDESPTPARARALNGVTVATFGVDVVAGLRWAEEALALNRAVGDTWGLAYSAFLRGQCANVMGDAAVAEESLSESLQLFREVRDDHYILLATDGLAGVYDDLGDTARARPLHEENVRVAREQGNRRIVALSLDQLASYARDEGRFADALAMLKESLGILVDVGDPLGIGENLARFARTLAAAGRPEIATRLLGALEGLYRQTAGGVVAWVTKINEETERSIRSQLDELTVAEAREQGRALTVDEAIALALDASV
jgi:tetratricopeptide (TPR) repeat protein